MKIINLLPQPRQRELYYDSILRNLWMVVLCSALSFVVVFLAQFGTKLYLEMQESLMKSQIQSLKTEIGKQENATVKDKIKTANGLIGDYNKLATGSPKWSQLVKAFVVLPPDGVKINNFTVNPQTKSITITGLSPTRELVIALHDAILNDKDHFFGIDYPFENVALPTNVSFHFTFFYKDSVIK